MTDERRGEGGAGSATQRLPIAAHRHLSASAVANSVPETSRMDAATRVWSWLHYALSTRRARRSSVGGAVSLDM